MTNTQTFTINFWRESDNDNGGYWETRQVDSMHTARRMTQNYKRNWSIVPGEYRETTLKIAVVDGKRIGSSELWDEYDTAPHSTNRPPLRATTTKYPLIDTTKAINILGRAGIVVSRSGSNLVVKTPYNDSIPIVVYSSVDYVARYDVARLLRTRKFYNLYNTDTPTT